MFLRLFLNGFQYAGKKEKMHHLLLERYSLINNEIVRESDEWSASVEEEGAVVGERQEVVSVQWFAGWFHRKQPHRDCHQ